MVDVAKLLVLIVAILVSVLLCFLTFLFLKKQNFYIDLQFQYKDSTKEGCGIRKNKEELVEDCPEERRDCPPVEEEDDCVENKPSLLKRTNRDDYESSCILDRDTLGIRFGVREQKNQDADYDTVHEKPGRQKRGQSNEKQRQRDCPSGEKQHKLIRKSQRSIDQKGQKGRIDKCYDGASNGRSKSHKPPLHDCECICECSCSDQTVESKNKNNLSESRWHPGKVKNDKKRVDCLVLVDAGQLPFECVKSNVLPKFPGNHNVTNNEKAKSPPGNKKSKSPHGKNGKSCGNMNLPEVAKKEKRTVDSSDNTSDDVTARKETSRVKFANVDKQRNDSPDSRRYRQHKEHQNIHDRSDCRANNITSCSNHNLEKLREKRKERKKTLMKLQYESGRLDDIHKWISGTSNSDVS
ncbi:hypothetical protein M8J75_007737 [Diaphorina citri]|nr:hypothetical protein M8J75_007737 [Diaphorina citri]